MKVLGVVVLVVMLVGAFNPLVDEVTDIGTDENATNYEVMMYNTFPYVYAVMVLCSVGAGVYWLWRR